MAKKVTEWERRVAAAEGRPIPGQHRTRRIALISLGALAGALAIAAVALTVLGGDGRERFLEDFNRVDEKVKERKGQLSATLRNVRLGERRDAQRLDAGTDALEQSLKAATELEAPDDLQSTVLNYRSANADLVARLREFAKALRRGKRRELNRLKDEAIEAQGAAFRAERAIRDSLAGG